MYSIYVDNEGVRTAKHYKDWTGGHNQYVPLNKGVDQFKVSLRNLLIQNLTN